MSKRAIVPISPLVSTQGLVQCIETHQDVQRRNAPMSDAWQRSRRQLDRLLPEMQRRQALNNGELDWRKWK